jgi:hypothetical protein
VCRVALLVCVTRQLPLTVIAQLELVTLAQLVRALSVSTTARKLGKPRAVGPNARSPPPADCSTPALSASRAASPVFQSFLPKPLGFGQNSIIGVNGRSRASPTFSSTRGVTSYHYLALSTVTAAAQDPQSAAGNTLSEAFPSQMA